MMPRGEVRLTLRQEKDLDKIILKIGLLINALAADLSPEETDYRRTIKEVEFSVKGMLMKMQANGIKPEVMTPQELKSFVQTLKMNILKKSGFHLALLHDNQKTFSYPVRLTS
ncbi:hypothetical protein IM793_11555 [Pedobacter sp. MR2016-19]|uniref:hypothetical protein n=1 Tax=Pedobacter sp. MR2016-19 TaxID=2780089 RepID=UPI0018747EDC|nr:hypothetical protein [Pedobacter sp. MR2016-19]MBE5319797.1 hypothetical protein [Pedobacter sp. MR2016-19]